MPNDVDGSPMTRQDAGVEYPSRRILGLRFFNGEAVEAVERMRRGGLLVVPAAPALSTLSTDKHYREALLGADLTITDSAFMVIVWNILQRDRLHRLSGLEYFSELVHDADFRREAATLYVMASDESARTNVTWLRQQGIPVDPRQVYVAPLYRDGVSDPVLLERVRELRPQHVLITVGGGVQERLGLYLKRSLDYLPAIHCIGAAIAFRSGDQVYIPGFADRLALGWLMRCLWRPKNYIPRYWAARRLAWLLFRYRSELPPLEGMLADAGVESSVSVA